MKKPIITIDGKEVTDVREIDEALSCNAQSAGGVELTTGEQAMNEITKRFSELLTKGRKMNRPPNRPTCKHGNTPGRCDDCNREQIRIEKEVKPLEDLYWESHGQNRGELRTLLSRAYRMGIGYAERTGNYE